MALPLLALGKKLLAGAKQNPQAAGALAGGVLGLIGKIGAKKRARRTVPPDVTYGFYAQAKKLYYGPKTTKKFVKRQQDAWLAANSGEKKSGSFFSNLFN